MSEEKLSDFLNSSKDWSRMKTSVPGVFVLKLPQYWGSPPRLAVELNPVDDTGRSTRRRGPMLRSSSELEEFNELFQYEKLSKLLGMDDLVNPVRKAVRKGKEDPVLEL